MDVCWPGTGWGCLVCHPPMDEALAVLCDECAQSGAKIKWVIFGPVWNGERILLEHVTDPFDHDVRYHPEVAEGVGNLN